MRFLLENYDIERKKNQTTQIHVGIQIFFLLDHLIQEYVFIQKLYVYNSPPTSQSRGYMNGIDQK